MCILYATCPDAHREEDNSFLVDVFPFPGDNTQVVPLAPCSEEECQCMSSHQGLLFTHTSCLVGLYS